MGRISLVFCVVGLLAGCVPEDLTPTQTRTICRAMVGPIRYNTYDKQSQRYAAVLLALDLNQRNQIYTRLHCSAKSGGKHGKVKR